MKFLYTLDIKSLFILCFLDVIVYPCNIMVKIFKVGLNVAHAALSLEHSFIYLRTALYS